MSDTQFQEKEYSTSFDFGIWKRLLYLQKNMIHWLFAIAGFMIAVAVVDGVFPLLIRFAVDTLIPQATQAGFSGKVTQFVLTYLFLAVVQGLNVFIFIVIAGVVEVRVCHSLREKGFRQLQKLSFSYYDRTPAGWIISRMTSDVQKLADTIAWGVVDMVWGSTMMITIIIYMFFMNASLALVALLFIPPLLIATFWFQKKVLGLQRKVRKTNSQLTGVFNEGLQGARTSKILVVEGANKEDFSRQSDSLKRFSLRAARLSALFLPLVIFLSASGAALSLGVGGLRVLGGTLSYGTLVAFISYAMMFFDPAREFARVLSEFQSAQASAERLISLIETEPEIQDRPGALNSGMIEGELALRNVGFHYGNGQWIFKNFSLHIPAGQVVAIVGETGSGKSTLVNLLCRFYEPQEGSIEIDGRDYRERTCHWLHSRLGYVLQTPLLFTGTVRENIRYGRLDATDEEVECAAADANAVGFINALDKGFETLVGEGGVLLSTGQKQLISIARALVANPRIMVLDEATSSVDTETEILIQGAIDRLLSGRTSIVIAHRLSTIRNADRIIVMDKGQIIEEGSHDGLMLLRKVYYRLYTRQFLDVESLIEASSVAG